MSLNAKQKPAVIAKNRDVSSCIVTVLQPECIVKVAAVLIAIIYLSMRVSERVILMQFWKKIQKHLSRNLKPFQLKANLKQFTIEDATAPNQHVSRTIANVINEELHVETHVSVLDVKT